MEDTRRAHYHGSMTDHELQQREKQRRAEKDLRDLARAETVFAGSVAAAWARISAHFAGGDTGDDDSIEIWGKRIGRILSAVGVVALGLYLYLTYFR